MRTVRKIIIIISKTVACIFALAILAAAATSFSPVYHFRASAPFTGPDIYDPYRNIDSVHCWKRANFHTHTRVDGLLNECEYYPDVVDEKLRRLGYEIVTFSNHNRLTKHPFDTSLQVNVYEHGYNLFKFHKLVFGCSEVDHRDHLLPIFAFQKQHQIDYLGKRADFIQINHPLRTNFLDDRQFEKLSGYRLIELDSGRSTENKYWDTALSAGHYSFGAANDDLHYPDRSSRIGVRCNFLCSPSAEYEDIRTCLLEGCFYAMRVPDYGNGDWDVKYDHNRHLPYVTEIGLKDSTIVIELSEKADSIKVTGQNHTTLKSMSDSDRLEYTMRPEDSYARITAYMPEGEVIYTNPFARYDATLSDSPYNDHPQKINILLTILFNLAVALICLADTYAIYLILRKRR